MQRSAIVGIVLGLVGCTTHGSPPAHAPVAEAPPPSCLLAVRDPEGSSPPSRDWYLARAEGLIAALEATGWFREVGFLADAPEHPDFILEVLPSPNTLNEPYLAVMTLGLVPNPLTEWHGYRFRLYTSASNADREIDVSYSTTGWFGWLAPLLALLPRQHLEEPAELHASYFARELSEHAPELSRPCSRHASE